MEDGRSWTADDVKYMRLALELAERGKGLTSPNPMVGAVLVKDGRIIGQGRHERCGEAHAEVNAFLNASEDPAGADLYVTLEPCSHHGKTPPCADLVIEKGVRRVVAAMEDPNELVAGQGLERLREAGIVTEVGLLGEESAKLNEVFLKYITTKKPFVTLKTAMTLDGKIATRTGMSRWISSEQSRQEVHQMRSCYSAIMVGIQTVLEDNPRLTCRIEGGRNPVRIICDSRLRIPEGAEVLNDGQARTILAVTTLADPRQILDMEQRAEVLVFDPDDEGHVPVPQLMEELGQMGIDSILLEGGSNLAYSFLRSGCVDKVVSYIAPMMLGGLQARSPVEGEGIADLADAFRLQGLTCRPLGPDIVVEGYVAGR